MTTEHEKWLNSTFEEVIEPEIPIVDSHHHFFDRDHLFFNQLDGEYMLDELLEDIDGNNVVKTVFVDAHTGYRKDGPEDMRPVGETELVQGITMESTQRGMPGIAAGIVSWADLSLGDRVAPILEAHIMAGKGRFRGIRQMYVPIGEQKVTPNNIIVDTNLREAFVHIKKYNLVFDTVVNFNQMTELAEMVRVFSDTTFVLNHIGFPPVTDINASEQAEVIDIWKNNLTLLTSCKNLFIKVGGFAKGSAWQKRSAPAGSEELAKAATPWVNWLIEKFGTGRCMFESNFPVDRMAFSYNVVWNAYKRMTRDFSHNERLALFHDTAVKAYRL